MLYKKFKKGKTFFKNLPKYLYSDLLGFGFPAVANGNSWSFFFPYIIKEEMRKIKKDFLIKYPLGIS